MFNDDYISEKFPKKKEQPIPAGKFTRLGDIYEYIKASAIVYLPKETVAQNSKTLLPKNFEYVNFKYVRYRQMGSSIAARASASAMSSGSDSWAFFFGDNRTNFLELESKEKKETIIALRGTVISDFKDVADDFEIAKATFFPISAQLKTEIEEILFRNSKKGYKTIFTGHSLGGYIACRLALDFNQKAVIFDTPGIDALSLPQDKLDDLDIHCFVSSPNFVNCVGSRVGKLYHIPRTETKDTPTILGDAYQGIKVEIEKDTLEPANNYVKQVISACAKWFFCRSIASLTHIKHETVETHLESFIGSASKVSEALKKSSSKVIEVADKKHFLREKWFHTERSHSIDAMLSSVLTFQNQNIKRLHTWPDLQEFLNQHLTLLQKLSFVEEISEQSSSVRSSTEGNASVSLPAHVAVPAQPRQALSVEGTLSKNENLLHSSKKRKISPHVESIGSRRNISDVGPIPDKSVISPPEWLPDKPSKVDKEFRKTDIGTFLRKRSGLYFFILIIVLLLCKLTDSLDKTNVTKGLFCSLILVELLLKFEVVSERDNFITALFAPAPQRVVADKKNDSFVTPARSF